MNRPAWPVVDFHVHVGDRDLWHGEGLELAEAFPGNGVEAQWDDRGVTDVGRLLDHLDVEGIAHAVLIPVGYQPVAFDTIAVAERGRGRLHPFVSIDPRVVVGAAERLEEAFARGAKGLKVHLVNDKIYANDPALYPLYEVCRSRGRPVMFHVGSSVFPVAKHRFADPMAVDEVAADFRELQVICAHAGRGFWESQVFFLARTRPNVVLELSGLPAKRIAASFPELDRVRDRVLYGSDWPTAPGLGEVVSAFLSLPYPEEALRAMMFDNAARLLGLESGAAGDEGG